MKRVDTGIFSYEFFDTPPTLRELRRIQKTSIPSTLAAHLDALEQGAMAIMGEYKITAWPAYGELNAAFREERDIEKWHRLRDAAEILYGIGNLKLKLAAGNAEGSAFDALRLGYAGCRLSVRCHEGPAKRGRLSDAGRRKAQAKLQNDYIDIHADWKTWSDTAAGMKGSQRAIANRIADKEGVSAETVRKAIRIIRKAQSQK